MTALEEQLTKALRAVGPRSTSRRSSSTPRRSRPCSSKSKPWSSRSHSSAGE